MKKRLRKAQILFWVVVLLLSVVVIPVKAKEKNDNTISINEHVILFNLHNDELLVKELYQITNNTANDIQGFTAPLPKGAANLVVNKQDEQIVDISAENYEIKDNEVVLQESLGSNQKKVYLMYYTLKMEDKKDFNNTVLYPTDTVYVLVPTSGFSFNSEELHSMGQKDIGGIEYQVYAVHDLTETATFSFEIVKNNKGAGTNVTRSYSENIGFHSQSHLASWDKSSLRNTNPHLWLIFLFVLVIGMGILINLFIKQKNQQNKLQNDLAQQQKVHTNLLAKQKRLLQRIKDLDKQWEAGQIEQEVYSELRQQYKQVLIKVKLRLKQLEEMG